MRKKLACCIGLSLAILGVIWFRCDQAENEQAANVMGQRGADLTTLQSEDTEEIQDDMQQQLKKYMPIQDLGDAYEVILNFCKKDFIGGHPLDEAFLNWIYGQYGEEVVKQLAEEVAGTQNTEKWYELTGNTIQVLWLKYCQSTGLQQYELENVYWQTCAAEDKTVLNFTGDINFDENWVTTKHMDNQPNGIYDCFSADLLDEMNRADIMMVNNEFTYSNRGMAQVGKDYTFRAKPERVALLETFGTDIVSLANNHVWDFGEEALLDTLDTLTEADMPYVGAGKNLDEAKKIVYFVANGRKIAIVAATQIERSLNYTKEATDSMAGVLKTLNPDKFVGVIETAKANSDIVIVFCHWGTEGDSNYGQDQKNLAKAFVEAGADVIIGGHTHCLQGVSYVDGVPVIYSLGNFWFSQSTLDTGMSQVIINKDGGIDFRFIPCLQKNLKTTLVTAPEEKARVLNYMRSISDGVQIDEDGYITPAE